MLECDLIIYDLHTGDLTELEEKLKLFKTTKFEEQKTIVLISSVLVWGQTEPKMVPLLSEAEKSRLESQLEEVDESKISEEPAKTDTSIVENLLEEEKLESPRQNFVKAPYEEADFALRKPSIKYEAWKNIEDLVLSLGNRENINVFILCSGILYGNGEKVFNYHFRSAWLETPRALPFITPGDNFIPTIHIKDLAKITKFVIDSKSEAKYIFAIDKTKDASQKSIIKAISTGIGTGDIGEVSQYTEEYSEWYQELSINVWMKPSSLLVPESVEGEEEGNLPLA